MELTQAFKKAAWHGGRATDAFLNLTDRMGATDLAVGYFRAGREDEMRVVLKNVDNRIGARKEKRQARKPL